MFRNCFNLSTQYNLVRILCTYSLQKEDRVRIMIDQPAFTNCHELTQMGLNQFRVQISVCLYILIHNGSVWINRKGRKSAGYCFQ